MGFRCVTTCLECWIAIKPVPFKLSVILIRIRVVVFKSQITRRLW